jgi:hypothetical protein
MTQMLQFFDRTEFDRDVKKTKAERHARGFSSWDHFVSMLFCQISDAQSLREITGGLASCEGKLEQFGITAPNKSTLSYANRNRPWQLFENVFYNTFQHLQRQLGAQTKFRFKNPVKSIDSSVVTLSAEIFDWATWSRQKGAVKLHLMLDHGNYMPEAMVLTTGKYSELTVARRRRYQRGTVLVMDRGFIDFHWFHQLQNDGVIFVTRMKKETKYEVVESRAVVPNKGVLSDQMIKLTSRKSRKNYPDQLRLVRFRTKEGEEFDFLTNNTRLAASTIAAIYQDRWQIEVFFKLIKQNLRIKTFVGTSANAVWTQIWTAMIGMLLIKFLQLKARAGWSFSNLVAFLRMNLLVYRDLWQWLDNPFTAPPPPPVAKQLSLELT